MSDRSQARVAEPPTRAPQRALEPVPTHPAQPRGPLAPPGIPANDAAPPPPAPHPGDGRDFSELPVMRGTGRIDDADEARALVTRLLIDELAPLLGLDPARIRVRVDESARVALEARGASGLQSGAEILLHPERYRPETDVGRYLLAHEAAHVAQRRDGAPARLSAVEDEAHQAALAFARRRPVRRPRRAPATTEVAAYEGPDPKAAFLEVVRSNYADELALIRDVMSYGFFDWAVTDGDVAEVLRILEPLPYITQVAIVGSLQTPYPARLADNVSATHFKRYRTSILAAYDAVTQISPSDLQDDPFEGMDFSGLSTAEHYALARIIPAFETTAKGKAWRRRLNPRISAHVTDILSRTSSYDPDEARKTALKAEQTRAEELKENEKLRASGHVAGFLEKAREKLSYHALDWAITDSETLSLLDEVGAFANSPAKLRAIVDTLEGEGLMARWVDNIRVETLYTDAPAGGINRRSLFLRLLTLRPPWKNARLAEELLSYGLFDWAVTDEDAYLAFQLLKSLPEKVRAGVLAEGSYSARLDDNLSQSMKTGRAANYYSGGKDGGDLQSIKSQLLDDEVWTVEQISRLRMLIQMARAADEGAWVFDLSRSRVESGRLKAAYADQDFYDRVVKAFELYVPPGFTRPDGTVDARGRTAYAPEQLRGKAFGTDNFFYQYVIKGLGFLFDHTGNLELISESIGGDNLDFRELEPILGGSFAGVNFAKASEVRDANTADMTDNSVRLDLDHGVLEMRAALLAISAVNYPLPDAKFQTGPIRIHGLHLHMEYPQNNVRTTTILRLRIDRVEISDFMKIGSDSMLGIERIEVGELHLDMAPEAGMASSLAAPDESIAVGAVLLTPVYNLAGIGSAIDALKGGLMTPYTALDVTATAGSIALKGLTTSGGQFIQQISLREIALRSRNTYGPRGYKEELLKQRLVLTRRLAEIRQTPRLSSRPAHWVEFDTAGSVVRELRSIEAEIKALDEAEAEVKALEAKAQAGQLNAPERERLERRKAFLAGTMHGGMALDIGGVEVKGVAGRVAMGDASLEDVHAYGNSPGAVLGAVTGGTVNRMLRGSDYRGTLEGVELEGDPNAFVKLGNLELNAFSVMGDIPTVEAAQKDYDAAEAARAKSPFDPKLADNAVRLQTRLANARTYWTLIRSSKLETADRDAFNAARKALREDKAFAFDRFTATGATLELARDAKGVTQVGLDVRTLGLHGVRAGGLKIDDVVGADVRLGAGADLLALAKARRLQAASVSAGSLRFSGIEERYSGVKAEQLNFTNLRGRGDFAASGTTAELAADSIELVGLNQELTARALAWRRDKLTAKPEAERTAADRAQLKDIGVLLGALEQARDLLAEADTHLADPKISAADKARYVEQKTSAEQMLAFWQKSVELKKLTIRDLDIGVSGLGDVMADDYSFSQAVKGGITVTGKGPRRQIASGVTAEGGWTRLSAGEVKDVRNGGSKVIAGSRASLEKIETGPIRGAVTYAENHISVDGLEIASLETQGLVYAGGDTVISGKGGLKVDAVSLSARADFSLVDESQPEGDRRLSKLHIYAFKIGRLEGRDIEYRNAVSGLRVRLTSGAIIGIHAEGAVVDFGAREGDPLLVRGGTAGFSQIQNLRTVATTAGGLAVSSNLNTGALDAAFADDGAITANLLQIGATAHVTQKDLDANINAKAKFLHVELLPGAQGYKDATQRGRISGLDLTAEGTKGVTDPYKDKSATRFGVKVEGFDSGMVTRTPDGRIEAPLITIPEIQLTRLHFDDGDMLVDVPDGQPVQVVALSAGVTLEPNPTPEAQRGKDEGPFSRIIVKDFHIPMIVARELTVVLRNQDKGDLMITLPANRLAVLKELKLAAPKGEDGFVIKPNDHWNMFGKATLESADFVGVGADLRSALISTMDVKATDFSVEFLGADDTIFAVKDLTVSRLDGRLKTSGRENYAPKTGTDPDETDTIVSNLKRAGFHLNYSHWTNDPKLHARGIRYSKKEGFSLEELDLQGLRYEDPDRTLKMDIRKASLPARDKAAPALKFTPEGKLIVPEAKVEDAAFTVDDVTKLGGRKSADGGVTADNGLTFAPPLETADLLSGHVYFTIKLFVRTGVSWTQTLGSMAAYVAGPYEVRVDIASGKINFGEVEDKSTGALADFALDIDYVRGSVDWNANPVRMNPARLQVSVTGLDPYWWELDGKEAALAQTGFVNISTFLKHPIKTTPADPDKEKASGSPIEALYFGDVDIHLEMPSNSEIKLGNAGSLTLGGPGPGFEIDVTSSSVPAIKAAIPKLRANVASMNLKLDTEGTVLKTGSISMEGGSGIQLMFDHRGVGDTYPDGTQNQLPVPTSLSGALSKATFHDIELQTAPDKKATK